MRRAIVPICVLAVALAGCNRSTSNAGQTATLVLKDGTTVAGTVTKSDSASITLQTANGVVSTYPIAQVASVSYTPAAAAPAPAARAASAPALADSSAPPASNQPPATPATSSAPATAAAADQQYVPADTFRTIPAGKIIAVRTDQSIDARDAAPGQTYSGVVSRDVFDTDGQVAIPRGSKATLVVRAAIAQGRVEGRSELALDVAAVQVDGRRYRLETKDFVERGREGVGANQRTAKFAGGGALLGGIIGAVAGGGKGAAIGALSGAAAGAGTQSVTRGRDVRIPAESVLSFRLESPVHIRELR
ncbi:MAG TPA: hypothetical protein VFW44_04710 [Bryobacteraceae bacterium]|nr:hypothetical protein [Bryobacteraceae bacterium]